MFRSTWAVHFVIVAIILGTGTGGNVGDTGGPEYALATVDLRNGTQRFFTLPLHHGSFKSGTSSRVIPFSGRPCFAGMRCINPHLRTALLMEAVDAECAVYWPSIGTQCAAVMSRKAGPPIS